MRRSLPTALGATLAAAGVLATAAASTGCPTSYGESEDDAAATPADGQASSDAPAPNADAGGDSGDPPPTVPDASCTRCTIATTTNVARAIGVASSDAEIAWLVAPVAPTKSDGQFIRCPKGDCSAPVVMSTPDPTAITGDGAAVYYAVEAGPASGVYRSRDVGPLLLRGGAAGPPPQWQFPSALVAADKALYVLDYLGSTDGTKAVYELSSTEPPVPSPTLLATLEDAHHYAYLAVSKDHVYAAEYLAIVEHDNASSGAASTTFEGTAGNGVVGIAADADGLYVLSDNGTLIACGEDCVVKQELETGIGRPRALTLQAGELLVTTDPSNGEPAHVFACTPKSCANDWHEVASEPYIEGTVHADAEAYYWLATGTNPKLADPPAPHTVEVVRRKK